MNLAAAYFRYPLFCSLCIYCCKISIFFVVLIGHNFANAFSFEDHFYDTISDSCEKAEVNIAVLPLIGDKITLKAEIEGVKKQSITYAWNSSDPNFLNEKDRTAIIDFNRLKDLQFEYPQGKISLRVNIDGYCSKVTSITFQSIIQLAVPNLIISEILPLKNNPKPGELVKVKIVTENVAKTKSAPTTTRVTLGRKGIFGTVVLDDLKIPRIGPPQIDTIEFQIPNLDTEDTLFIYAEADYFNDLNESSDSDNRRSVKIGIPKVITDLKINNALIEPFNPEPGDCIKVTAEVKNVGERPVDIAFISWDIQDQNGSSVLEDGPLKANIANIGIGQIGFQFTEDCLPSTLDKGEYTLKSWVSLENGADDIPSNDTASFPIGIGDSFTKSDLEFSQDTKVIFSPNGAEFLFDVENNTNTKSTPFQIEVVLHDERSLPYEFSGNSLFRIEQESLEQQDKRTFSYIFNGIDNIPAGRYYLHARILNEADANYLNNVYLLGDNVFNISPDLAVTEVKTTESNIIFDIGEPISIRYNIENQGIQTAPNCELSFLYGKSSNINDATLLFTKELSVISPRTSRTFLETIDLTVEEAGSYFIFVAANLPENCFSELGASENNFLFTSIVFNEKCPTAFILEPAQDTITVREGELVKFKAYNQDAANYNWYINNEVYPGREIFYRFSPKGLYQVGLNVEKDCGLANDELWVKVERNCNNESPIIKINPDPGPYFVGDSISFSISDCSGCSVQWDIGEKKNVVSPTIRFIPGQSGLFTVNARVINECGGIKNIRRTFSVQNKPCPIPDVSFIKPLESVFFVGDEIIFEIEDCDECLYWWDLGDGNTRTGKLIKHTFSNPGTKLIQVITKNQCGKELVNLISVEIESTCEDFEIKLDKPFPKTLFETGEKIPFSALGCSDCSFRWKIEDELVGSGRSFEYSFNSEGVKKIILEAENSCRRIKTTSYSFLVEDDCPDFRVDFDLPSPRTKFFLNESIPFQLSGCNDCEYFWDFGDGTKMEGNNIAHSFNTIGEKRVVVTAINSCNISFTNDYILYVDDFCPDFRVDFDTPSPQTEFSINESITFDLIGCDDCEYYWNFDDGSIGEGNPVSHKFASQGNKRVVVKAVNSCGKEFENDYILNINSSEPCDESFRIDFDQPSPITSFELGELIPFKVSGCSDCTYLWDFGDGTQKVGNPVNHRYFSTGSKTVYTTATNSCGKSFTNDYVLNISDNTICNEFRVDFDLPTPRTVFSKNESINFQVSGCDNCTYSWDFGDGSSGSGNPVSHRFSSTGQKTILVTATKDCGKRFTNDYVLTIVNDNPPGDCADFRVDFSQPQGTDFKLNENIPFEVYGCDNCTYSWDFGDGSSGKGNPVSHRFSSTGQKTILVTATKDCGKRFTNDYVLTIVNDNPPGDCADFRVDFSQPQGTDFKLNENIPFEVYGCDNCTYSWDFGDGSSGSGNPVSHRFSSTGQKTILVTATKDCGKRFTNDYVLTIVNDNPPGDCADFRVDFSQPQGTNFKLNENIPFEVYGCDNCTYSWDFGDGSSGSGNPVSHRFSSTGQKTILVTATKDCGKRFTNDYVLTIVNDNPPGDCADFRVDFSQPQRTDFKLNENIPFEVYGCDNCTYSWDFGDGSSGSGNPVSHRFSSAGQKTILVTAIKDCGKRFTNDYVLTIVNDNPPGDCADFRVDFSQPQRTDFKLNENIPFEVYGCDNCTYSWDFGDGSSGSGNPVSHRFSSTGQKTILVTATKDCGKRFTNDYVLQVSSSIENAPSNLNLLGSDIKVYPVPSNDEVWVKFFNEIQINMSATLSDTKGGTIWVKNQINPQNEMKFSLSSLKKGVYFLTIVIGENRIVKKILKI